MRNADKIQKLTLTASGCAMARSAVDGARTRLRELFDAGEEYGPWALALQEIAATLATVDAEVRDEIRRSQHSGARG